MLKHIKTAHIFVIIAALFGLFFVFSTPLLWGTDETSHLARIYQISGGQILPERVGDTRNEGGYGGYIPENLYRLILYVDYNLTNNVNNPKLGIKYVNSSQTYTVFGKLYLNNSKKVEYGFPNTSVYSPIAYIPALTGIIISNNLHVNVYWTIMIMRLFDLVFYITVVWLALMILNNFRAKWIIFAVALLPTALYSVP